MLGVEPDKRTNAEKHRRVIKLNLYRENLQTATYRQLQKERDQKQSTSQE